MFRRDADKSKSVDIFLYVVTAILVVLVAFQLFGRFTYVHTQGNSVVRIDRLSGETCSMPCQGDISKSFIIATPRSSPSAAAKECHSANVVRVASAMRIPPNHRPISYHRGGFEPGSATLQDWKSNVIPFATELSDGHIYAFSSTSFVAVNTWSTGEDVFVCATWSKIESRPFFSVGPSEGAEPATLAI